jgi:hypothetical protein
MLLGYEEGIEVPESRFNERLGGHLSKSAHIQLGSHCSQGVKTYPISKKILLISALTFSSWWKAPPDVGVPSASKLYFLNFATFHAPLMRQISASLDTKVRLANLASISAVKSVSGFSLETLKSEPLETENH